MFSSFKHIENLGPLCCISESKNFPHLPPIQSIITPLIVVILTPLHRNMWYLLASNTFCFVFESLYHDGQWFLVVQFRFQESVALNRLVKTRLKILQRNQCGSVKRTRHWDVSSEKNFEIRAIKCHLPKKNVVEIFFFFHGNFLNKTGDRYKNM